MAHGREREFVFALEAYGKTPLVNDNTEQIIRGRLRSILKHHNVSDGVLEGDLTALVKTALLSVPPGRSNESLREVVNQGDPIDNLFFFAQLARRLGFAEEADWLEEHRGDLVLQSLEGTPEVLFRDITREDIRAAVVAWWKPANTKFEPDAADLTHMTDAITAALNGRQLRRTDIREDDAEVRDAIARIAWERWGARYGGSFEATKGTVARQDYEDFARRVVAALTPRKDA